MLFDFFTQSLSPLRTKLAQDHRRAEADSILPLYHLLSLTQDQFATAQRMAILLVKQIRKERIHTHGLDALMQEFSLDSQEGIALMCLAESLLRVPDVATADALIRDKLGQGDWHSHLGHSPSIFINAAVWGLLISGKLVTSHSEQGLRSALSRIFSKGGESLIRKGMDLAVRLLGKQFVAGETIAAALKHAQSYEAQGYRYSYDMLGEAAITNEEAQYYFNQYIQAIHAIGATTLSYPNYCLEQRPGISIKLSALHPRYQRSQKTRAIKELFPRLQTLMQLAHSYQLGVNIDAEESERFELSLDLFEQLAFDLSLENWQGLGFVVQAYQKRAATTVEWLIDLAQRSHRRLLVRLVKGAYWDSEIKRAQIEGQQDYPVYTRKAHTDVAYLVCAQKLLAAGDCVYPQFATHNALTLCILRVMAQSLNRNKPDAFEFQCLHGMGESIYDKILADPLRQQTCRIYAPVGPYKKLLAYLVRRLLENGANSSFVHQLVDTSIPLKKLLFNPLILTWSNQGQPHPLIPLPSQLYGNQRKNSSGFDFSNELKLIELEQELNHFATAQWCATPLLAHTHSTLHPRPTFNPAQPQQLIGGIIETTSEQAAQAITTAVNTQSSWSATSAATRANYLQQWAELIQVNQYELAALCVREAGKTIFDAFAEVREAIDYCRYYAQQILHQEAQGTAGTALGVTACISPWNFPLAIFTGQIAAALVTGNVVLAKPAEQTSLIATRCVQLAHQAGIPTAVLQLLPGSGEQVGKQLISDPQITMVLFTGSISVAHHIHEALAQQKKETVLIAETGGQNAMIVDSSAMLEQVVNDVIASAYNSAGQRCSALRVLCIQDDIADNLLSLLKGAMQELTIGDPAQSSTDIGPIINETALQIIEAHIRWCQQSGFKVFRAPSLNQTIATTNSIGAYCIPALIEIPKLAVLTQEIFGPVLHVLRYRRENLDQLLEEINATDYGLTFGIQSRIDETIHYCIQKIQAGNVYVNRNMIGATVGVQPFGGQGLSGTGPKAGGPLYLSRLMHLSPSQHRQINEFISTGTQIMQGPTGEHNQWLTYSRTEIGCLAETAGELLQLIQWSLYAGYRPVINNILAIAVKQAFPQLWIRFADKLRISNNVEQAQITALICPNHFSLIPNLRKTLAQRPGPITPLLTLDTKLEYHAQPWWRLMLEKTISVNTAAAGGNTNLMTL